MKRIVLLLVVLPLVLLAGCGGDSTTTKTPVTIDSGARTVGANSPETLSKFNIGEPGKIEVTVTWSTGPAELTLFAEAAGGAAAANVGGSPLVTSIDITQEILDNSTAIGAAVINKHLVDDAHIQFTITFTPAG